MKVGLDVDDCIANWYKAACEFCGVEYKPRNHWCAEESGSFIFPEWDNMKKDDDFWHELEVLNKVDFDFDYYITSLPPHLLRHRVEWLVKHNFPNNPVHIGHDKVAIAKELDVDVIIDDKPETIKAFIEAGKHAIHYLPPYTTLEPVSPYYTNDFSEVKDILNKIKQEHYAN